MYKIYSNLFLGGLLQTAQSYPSLSANNTTNNSCSITTIANRTFCVGEGLTMSLASTSSDSEQVSLEVSVFALYCVFISFIVGFFGQCSCSSIICRT